MLSYLKLLPWFGGKKKALLEFPDAGSFIFRREKESGLEAGIGCCAFCIGAACCGCSIVPGIELGPKLIEKRPEGENDDI
jgi:hypothetical protein